MKYNFDAVSEFSGDFMSMSVDFSTTKKQGILMKICDASCSQSISFSMNEDGGVTFVNNIGTNGWNVSTPKPGVDFANGKQQKVSVQQRGNGHHVIIKAGIYGWDFVFADLFDEDRLDSLKYLFVGNNVTSNLGFEGCLSKMKIYDVYPLELAFQDPRPSYIEFTPEGEIHEAVCGSTKRRKRSPDPIEHE
ncbi:hypothetical protein ScPMuIL_013849 [Solemya velum]